MADAHVHETGRTRMGKGGLNHWSPAEARILTSSLAELRGALPGRSLKAIVKRLGVIAEDIEIEEAERG